MSCKTVPSFLYSYSIPSQYTEIDIALEFRAQNIYVSLVKLRQTENPAINCVCIEISGWESELQKHQFVRNKWINTKFGKFYSVFGCDYSGTSGFYLDPEESNFTFAEFIRETGSYVMFSETPVPERPVYSAPLEHVEIGELINLYNLTNIK